MKNLLNKFKKIKKKLTLKQNKVVCEQVVASIIKVPVLTDMTGIEFIQDKLNANIPKEVILKQKAENLRLNFKKLVKEEQLKTLFNYLKSTSEGGLFKKDNNAVIGEYFGVSRDTIRRRIKDLEISNHIGVLTDLDRFYKILKEEY